MYISRLLVLKCVLVPLIDVLLCVSQNARSQVQVHVKHYYRATEVPDSVYLPLVHDRNVESSKSRVFRSFYKRVKRDTLFFVCDCALKRH